MKTNEDFWKQTIRSGAALNPIDRISEVLFGLIMVLTFTGALSITNDGREEIREVLWAALGCNIAWGIVDAIMYLMNVVLERGHYTKAIESLRETKDPEKVRSILKGEIQPVLAALMTDEELDRLGDRMKKLPAPKSWHLLTGADLLAGLQIFLLVFLCTLPVALPFAFVDEVSLAMRTSNGVALVLLFIGGYLLARHAGFWKILTALVYTLIGVFLVSLTMLLGG